MAALNNNIFPFLSLPGELRNPIYRHLLVGGRRFNAFRYAQILRTCKQINREATGILYAENIVRISISSSDVLVHGLPQFSTGIPLQRIERLYIYIRPRSQSWDYKAVEPLELEVNILALCRSWPKNHALKRLAINLVWEVQSNVIPQHYYHSTHGDPDEEVWILSPFSLLQNIESVSIRSSIPADVHRNLMIEMHGENEWEETV
ncbi:MAG: hypothetical protein FRX48_07905 [Lasallia pustulata]|uniref:F-box domain-containing protein n=1 Tax=Lasallia pustulata TaxID=136370 RepID=A0A5M8PGE8_9LECA|nr:MAG: hypothetical protein FRX48_07905 [Lasallia pustulata]